MEFDRELRVTLAGDRSGEYVIVDEREDGSLILAPDTSRAAIRRRHRLVLTTLAELKAECGAVAPRMAKVEQRRGDGHRARRSVAGCRS